MDLMLFLLVSGLGIGAGLHNWRESWRAEGRRRSSVLARARLRAVIAADREAANDGRWIRKFHPDREQRGMLGLAMALLCSPMSDKWLNDDRPRYRWEPRR